MTDGKAPRIRCFVCLEPDSAVRSNLERWLEPLRAQAPRLRWVRPGALHLTLKFCGEISEGQVERLCSQLRKELPKCVPFRLGLEGTGVFPLKGAPRVLWGGITGEVGSLTALAKRVEVCAVASGIPREKRSFSPHLTLARIRSASDVPGSWLSSVPPGKTAWGNWTVREAILMESDLRPEGPRYNPIEKFPLLKFQGGER